MLTVAVLSAYLYQAMIEVQPLETQAYLGEYVEETDARYHAWAGNTAAAILMQKEPLFPHDDGTQAASLLVQIWHKESHGIASVMLCEEGGDGGRSWGSFQTQRHKVKTCESYYGAAEVALEMIRESFALCGVADGGLRLYTDGPGWRTDRAWKRSRARMKPAQVYASKHSLAVQVGGS